MRDLALDTLRTLNRGRSYLPVIGRKIRPETMFGFDSLFETLPGYRPDLFFDEQGELVEILLEEGADGR